MRPLRMVFGVVVCAILVYFVLLFLLPQHSKHFRPTRPDQTARPSSGRSAVLKQQERVRAAGERRLRNLEAIRRANSDLLPRSSAFGTRRSADICRGKNERRCFPKFLQMETRIRVSKRAPEDRARVPCFQTAPNLRLGACVIQKGLSTVVSSLLCFLRNETAFRAAGRSFDSEYAADQFCPKAEEAGSVAEAKRSNEGGEWTFFVVVRDPIDRFLSGYVDKCIRNPTRYRFCNGCGANFTCFVLSEFRRFERQIRAGRLERTFEDRHFAPQNWHCDLDREHFRCYQGTQNHSLAVAGLPTTCPVASASCALMIDGTFGMVVRSCQTTNCTLNGIPSYSGFCQQTMMPNNVFNTHCCCYGDGCNFNTNFLMIPPSSSPPSPPASPLISAPVASSTASRTTACWWLATYIVLSSVFRVHDGRRR
ncbi:hypothetical protein M3Y99_01662500 [Aphelenchoides fujianensis]|nr:hypothetical protein M3Y99_01662500 [Aphelenchoides fujianensis]